jgi:hypothetical protein
MDKNLFLCTRKSAVLGMVSFHHSGFVHANQRRQKGKKKISINFKICVLCQKLKQK